jgi:hypothetical protein
MDQQDKYLLVFIVLTSMLIIFLASADAFVYNDILLDPSLDWPEDTYAMTMCKLLVEEPYYDCSVTWLMIYLPTTEAVNEFCYKDDAPVGLSWIIVGCAFIPQPGESGESKTFIVGSSHFRISHTGETVLAHELKHMTCKCNFHD